MCSPQNHLLGLQNSPSLCSLSCQEMFFILQINVYAFIMLMTLQAVHLLWFKGVSLLQLFMDSGELLFLQ